MRKSKTNASSSLGTAPVGCICASSSLGPAPRCTCKTTNTPSQCTRVASDSHNLAHIRCICAISCRIAHSRGILGIQPGRCISFDYQACPDWALCLRGKHIQLGIGLNVNQSLCSRHMRPNGSI